MTHQTNTPAKSRRIESLDWLRGLTALSIMTYHLCYWYLFTPDAGSFIGRMGIYGVSIFFILSGLSMAIVYSRFIHSIKSGVAFFVRRIFRIWPLLMIATIVTIVLSHNEVPPISTIILNLTGFFGFVPPFRYIATGAWSIGNEMFYYALTPFILWAFNYKKWVGNSMVLVCLCITIYFSFVLLSPKDTLVSQWDIYVHPLNNLSLYALGIAIYYNLKDALFNQKANSILLLLAIIALIFYPIDGNQIGIVTGFNRIAFILISLALVVGFYKITFQVPQLIAFPLEKLGLITYGVYILHPIVKLLVLQLGMTDRIWIVVSVYIITITVSLILYHLMELPLMKLGKKLTSKS
ncbi:MAG: acyltransferase family protein [Bacteroidales bacterium]